MDTVEFPSPKSDLLPHEILLPSPPSGSIEPNILDHIKGSLFGLAIGDAMGASVEFRPRQYLLSHPVVHMQSGGTWGLQAGQWTDDTSMALCLASSLISSKTFDLYSQMVRYKWWYKYGFLSSTGKCFDIGNATRTAIEEFSRRQFQKQRLWKSVNEEAMDRFSHEDMKLSGFDVFCGGKTANGNGALMRLAPVPLFFFQEPEKAVRLSGESARLTHGDQRAIDACRYFGALIVAALHHESKEQILSPDFYLEHRHWFGPDSLHREVLEVASGSFIKKDGYDEGIRGSGTSVKCLEAALWAFYKDQNSFRNGVLLAVNLGDDTDTTAAVYGQLAGAYYGLKKIPSEWAQQVYASNLLIRIAEWLQVLGGSSRSTSSPPQPSTITRMSQPSTVTQAVRPNYPQSLSKMVSNPTGYRSLLNPVATTSSGLRQTLSTSKPGYDSYYRRGTTRNNNPSSWNWYRHDQQH